MKQIITQQFIEASPETVWNILTDMDAYPEWNPFLIKMTGRLEKGGQITNTMRLGEKTMVFKPLITEYEVNQRLEWLGKMPLGLFNGRHYFVLHPDKTGTLLEHGEFFSGWLHTYLFRKIGEQTRLNFIAMNQALKNRAEKAR